MTYFPDNIKRNIVMLFKDGQQQVLAQARKMRNQLIPETDALFKSSRKEELKTKAEQGDRNAAYELGKMLLIERGKKRSAWMHIESAAKTGHMPAILTLSRAYKNELGPGGYKHRKKAYFWAVVGMHLGSEEAKTEMLAMKARIRSGKARGNLDQNARLKAKRIQDTYLSDSIRSKSEFMQ